MLIDCLHETFESVPKFKVYYCFDRFTSLLSRRLLIFTEHLFVILSVFICVLYYLLGKVLITESDIFVNQEFMFYIFQLHQLLLVLLE